MSGPPIRACDERDRQPPGKIQSPAVGGGHEISHAAEHDRLVNKEGPIGTSMFAEVYRVLEEKETQGVWEFEEAHYFNSGTMNQ